MPVRGLRVSDSQRQEATDVKCEFLSSFNTLKTLDIDDYGQYKLEVSENPELPSNLLPAILKHKNLEKLSISYNGIISGYQIPYLKPATVATILDNLPHLRDINIAPEEKDLVRRPITYNVQLLICHNRMDWPKPSHVVPTLKLSSSVAQTVGQTLTFTIIKIPQSLCSMLCSRAFSLEPSSEMVRSSGGRITPRSGV
jgi:hypothetical protein